MLKHEVIVDQDSHLMGALGIAILAKNNKINKKYDLNIKNVKFDTIGMECNKCSNNCEILKIYKDKVIIF